MCCAMVGAFGGKKIVLSLCCAFLMIMYAPLSNAVGNNGKANADNANAHTFSCCDECTTEENECEFCTEKNIVER